MASSIQDVPASKPTGDSVGLATSQSTSWQQTVLPVARAHPNPQIDYNGQAFPPWATRS